MEAVAYIKYLRISSKKLKSLGEAIVGLSPDEAIERLFMTGSKGGRMLTRIVESALANATNNLKLNPSSLRVKSVELLKGPFLKRWQPVARGSVHGIKKPMVHVKVTLEEKSSNVKAQKSKPQVKSQKL